MCDGAERVPHRRQSVAGLARPLPRYNQSVSDDQLASLKAAIDAAIAELMKDTRKAGRDSFAQKPRKFAKRLQKAVKRDLTPVDAHDPHSELA